MQKFRVGLIGCGFMGRMHAQVYAALETAELVAACDPVPGKAAGLAPARPDWKNLITDPDIDVIDICTPTPLHAEMTIAALESGKHVFCEKPIARTSADARQMVETAKATGKTLMIGQCIRFWPEYEILNRLVNSNELGELRSLNLTRYGEFPHWSTDGWLGDEAQSGGAVMDMHIHDTDFALHLLGEPSSVRSNGIVDHRGPSHAFTTMQFGDTVVQLEGGWNLPTKAPFKMAFRAIFERGAAIFDSGPLTLYRPDSEPEVPEIPKMAATAGGNISDLGGYFYELQYFYDQLAKGEAVDKCSPESALRSLEMVEREIAMIKGGA